MMRMMMVKVVLFGFFMTRVSADAVADVVLSCTLLEEGVGVGVMGGGPHLARTPATLVLRDVAVPPDESLEALTPFVPPSTPDPDAIFFEAKASSPDIPDVNVLLHADCNEREVMCEISHYSPRGSREKSESYFMASITVAGEDFSAVLIMQTLPLESELTQSKLKLPLSQSGTLLTEVVFLVFSHVKSVSAPLRGDVLLYCGFKQREAPPAQEVDVKWRLQHRGKGHRVIEMRTRPDDPEGSTVVHAERRGCSMDAAEVGGRGNASVTLTRLKVSDEGTYICSVAVGHFHAQQVVQLQITQPPDVSLSEEKLVLTTSPQTLSCHCSKYYPLDAQMEWFSLSPADSEPTALKDQISLSSHRHHGDGTYSLSSHLTVTPDLSPGTRITCKVSHPALDDPLSVSALVESPEPDSYWWVLGFMVVTVLFFYQVMR